MNRRDCRRCPGSMRASTARQAVRILCNAKVRALAPTPARPRARSAHPRMVPNIGPTSSSSQSGWRRRTSSPPAAGLESTTAHRHRSVCRTSDAAIYAPATASTSRAPLTAAHAPGIGRQRFEQGATAALTCSDPHGSRQGAWFWSDQYDLKLVIVGMCQGHDTVVTRALPRRAASAPATCVAANSSPSTPSTNPGGDPDGPRASSSLRTGAAQPRTSSRMRAIPLRDNALRFEPSAQPRPADLASTVWPRPGEHLATSPVVLRAHCGLHFHGFQRQQQVAAGHPGALGRGDGGDHPRHRRATCLALPGSACARRPFRDLAAIGHAHRARLTVQLEEHRARAVLMRLAAGDRNAR